MPGEPPLLVFISSVMRPEVNWARDETVLAVRGANQWVAWAFEYTPASSEGAEETYLQKVRTADIVVWLVGSVTTVPVRSEIIEALAHDRRILAVFLPVSGERDEETNKLIRAVHQKCKSVEVRNRADFQRILQDSIADEIVRALRGKPALGRRTRLAEIRSASIGRCVERWQAAGLSRVEARKLANDRSVGAPHATYTPQPDRPVILLLGPIGAGKSLTAERILQAAVDKADSEAGAPVPIYIDARFLRDPLMTVVLQQAEHLGNPRLDGATVVIDLADQRGSAFVDGLLAEARTITGTWQSTTVVITTRPLTSLAHLEEAAQITELPMDETLALIGRIAGREVSEYATRKLPESVQHAMRRPLFALLVGGFLRDDHRTVPRSTADLLSHLVERALGRTKADSAAANELLRKLAVRAVDSGRGIVYRADLGSRIGLQSMLDSGLVVEIGPTIAFALPIFMEWFAAHAIEVGEPTIHDLTQDLARLDRWRYPLIIAISYMGYHSAFDLLSALVAKYPAFAAEVIGEGLAKGGSISDIVLPSPAECAQQLDATTREWVKGFGRLAELVVPIDSTGQVRPCNVWTDGKRLMTTRFRGDGNIPAPGELPPGFILHDPSVGSWRRRGGHPSPHAGWAWRWTLEEFAGSLSDCLQSRAVPIFDGPIADETLWKVAVASLGHSPLSDTPIALDAFDATLPLPSPHKIRVDIGGVKYDPEIVRVQIAALRARGVQELRAPWPGPDRRLGGHFVWSNYSDEQLLRRVTTVYGMALRAYQQMVREWFANFAPSLLTSVVLPARLVGTVTPARSPDRLEDGPVMGWHIEALARDDESSVAFQLGEYDRTDSDLHAAFGRLRAYRPEAARWMALPNGSGVVDVFGRMPATEIAYGWLWDDLRRVGLVKGMLGHRS